MRSCSQSASFGEKLKLDGKVIVAQDFHHTSQGAKEIVSRIISRLENLSPVGLCRFCQQIFLKIGG